MSARILLIEDNAASLELMSYLLRAFGYTPETVEDGAEGLSAARRTSPDLIVCDIQLPTIDGYEVARLLKSDPALRSIPLVAVTAMAMVGDRERVIAAGFDGYVSKPINPETFVQQLEDLLHPRTTAPVRDRRPVAGADPAPPPGQCTVLVVDNLPVNVELARGILEPNGYTVVAANGCQEGLTAARRHPCDLILSDVCMAEESGYDFIRAVKEDPELAGVPFVFITSTMLNEKDRSYGLSLGAMRFLFRPIEPELFLAEINACLRKRVGHGDHPDR